MYAASVLLLPLICLVCSRQLSDEVNKAKSMDTSNTVFTKILNKEIPAVILHEDEKVRESS